MDEKYNDIDNDLYTIDTWDGFKNQLKKQLCPYNVKDIAIKKLHGLKHIGSIKVYDADFMNLMLKFPDLP